MSSSNLNTLIIIAGPTAVGKTAMAIRVASRLNTEVISADSRQCYREMTIGVAKPSQEQLRQVPHHFIDSHSIHDLVTAATFEQYALAKLESIFQHNNKAVVVGGTGLYIQALINGLDAIPPVDSSLREQINDDYKRYGLQWLQDCIAVEDPAYFASGEVSNPARLLRALEVVRGTGKSIRSFQQGKSANRNFNTLYVGLQLPKEQLHQNITQRTKQMIADGLVDEVASLISHRHLTALNTVGYKEIFSYLDGEISLDDATELISQNTRRYAKRQLTWFKKHAEYWLLPSDEKKLFSLPGM